MDKYEYKLRADEIKVLIGEGRYAEAAQIADTIDWKKVKSVRMLCTISDLYKINRRYEESREILLIANSRYPDGRYIIYSLCELSIKLQDIIRATEYFKEFVRVAPHNTSRYILQYKLYVAQDVSLEERIAVLQEFKKHDYREKWGYELAYLYHRVGLATECVEECDELFLWFGGGRFVIKAMELKALHEKLSPEQQRVYDRYRADSGEIVERPSQDGAPYDNERDEMGHDEEEQKEPEDGEFHVKTVDLGQYNTINLQQVIADSLKELQKKPAPPVPQETRVMEPVERPEKPMLDSTADTGILGITEEDLNAYEENAEEPLQETRVFKPVSQEAESSADRESATDRESVSDRESSAEQPSAAGEPDGAGQDMDSSDDVSRTLEQTAASIATDDTVWMPGFNEIARYAQQQGIVQPEVTARTIAQATGEIPMAEQIVENALREPVREPVPEMTVEPEPEPLAALPAEKDEAVTAPEKAQGQMKELTASVPAEDVREQKEPAEKESAAPTPEKRLVDELRTEVGEARDEMRRLRAAERRAEIQSREKSGRMREVSSDTRRLGQTREYVPITRMDKAVEAALGRDADENGQPVQSMTAREAIMQVSRDAKQAENRNVIRPTRKSDESGYDRLLAESPDGQISMAMDEKEVLERQITGQISIGDFLTGWEAYKKEQQRLRMESVKEYVRQNTGEIFRVYEERRQMEAALEKGAADGGPAALTEEPEGKLPAGPDLKAMASAAVPVTASESASAPAITPENATAPAAAPESEPVPSAAPESEPVPSATSESEPVPSDAPVNEPVASAVPADAAVPPATPEKIAHQLAVLEGKISPDTPVEAPTREADDRALDSADAAGPQPDAETVQDAVQTDQGAGADAQTGTTPESGAAVSAGGEEESEEASGEDDHVLRVMTAEEKELFGPYIHKKRSRKQIVDAIDSLSMAAYAGNVIITGEEGAGTINLAKGLIRSVQLSDANFSGQIAKISGRAMNRKRVDAIVEKLAGGALIIQGAGSMNNETTATLLKALQAENLGIIVILEDTKRGIEKYLKKHPEVSECFNVRVDVEALATKELVSYARQYALDREFSMDEFAVLALHKRIDEMQTAEHEVTIAEVREIVDEAIRRSTRKNPAHFFDILLQKRYDGEDMIILREKDFLR
ncbi:MAG: hypothetical protein K5696_10805 [Lachnospiraceae bacterium]|nr:hypothetical protein [Lachnospiraceae bacterium]